MRKLLQLFLPFLLLLSFTQTSFALSCTFPKLNEMYEGADAVFQGKVIEVKTLGAGQIATIQLSKRWKGSEKEYVQFRQSESELMWGYEFSEGEESIIFAHKVEDGYYNYPLCGMMIDPNSESEFATEFFKTYGEGVIVEPTKNTPPLINTINKEALFVVAVSGIAFVSMMGFLLFKFSKLEQSN